MEEEVKAEVIEDDKSLAVTYQPSVIQANFDALEAHVRETVADYQGASYDLTDAQAVKEAKHDRTYLNGLKKQIEERRKAVKREYTKPLDAFEKRCKQITAIIDEASDGIKAQLDQAEEARKSALYQKLAEHYEEFAGLLAPVVPYERIHEEQWTNKTFGEVKAMDAMDEKVSRLAKDWETLKAQRESMSHYDDAERELFRTLDLGAALNAARMADEEDARIAELKAAMEPEPASEPEPVAEPAAAEPMPAPEPVMPWVVVVPMATRAQMQSLAQSLKALGISGTIKQGTPADVASREEA